ncbi:hypothetical protein OEZ86_011671 [Tetradesmus obliquus]|uniref:Histone deacetylase complex subunit SAP30 Sin3 binding domain-containing protein n=1 Tax=Tetradesmus obliquus TaxID=3088 RepID=A0A383VPN2_TETOB|nr:hypothetical protein OEZ86_011671 [Tetradesmus obliquus]|eukprot:jgi/Sobl393_1/2647/SZX66702.1
MAATKARRTMNQAYGHSDEEDEYLGKTARNGAARRFNLASRIDFTKLELGSLQRYRKVYKLPEHPTATRDDLLAAIVRHFSNIYVDEDETLIKFAMACRRNGQRMGLGVKKPRTGSVKPRGGR